MARRRIDRVLSGTALAVILCCSTVAHSQAPSDQNAATDASAPARDSSAADPDITKAIPEPTNPAPAISAEDAPAAPAGNAQPATAVVPERNVEPASAAAPAPAPAPDVTAPAPAQTAENPLADKLRELITGRAADRYFARRNERAGAEAFYKDRNFSPLWVENSTQSPRAVAAIKYLQNVDADGLDPADYPIPLFKTGDIDQLAEAELRLTAEILEYARHASVGRVHFSRISNDIGFDREAPDAGQILSTVASASDMRQVLDSFQPQHPQYKALKAKLAEVRGKPAAPTEEIVRIPEGGKFKANADDQRVPLLRKRLKIAGDENSTRYDQDVIAAVKKFQQGAGLNGDGVAGPATLRALNGTGTVKRERSADIIIANLDRWRWMPRDLGKNHVLVNIPDYRLKLIHDDKLYWETKIVVGKPSQATPITTAQMKFITVNPTWNVPPSIIANEYLPAVRQDPGVLSRMGLKMEQNRDGTVRIYQPPGDRNALGRIRFNFPNKFLVYQHDTPDKNLFSHDKRAYSHGCMRVQDPLMYGEKLLSVMLPQQKYTQEKLRSMYGPAEVNINFPTALPVHLTYQTAFVDDAGNLQIREDVYGRDQRHLAVLRSDERKVADVAQVTRPTGSGITQDQLRYQTREAGPFADWYQSRGGYDRRGGSRVTRGPEPFGGFFGRMFR